MSSTSSAVRSRSVATSLETSKNREFRVLFASDAPGVDADLEPEDVVRNATQSQADSGTDTAHSDTVFPVDRSETLNREGVR